MIINLLKECCENCIHIDVKAENIVTSYRNMLESSVVKSTTATIWCAHMEVCKEYREAESKDESQFNYEKAPARHIADQTCNQDIHQPILWRGTWAHDNHVDIVNTYTAKREEWMANAGL